MARVKKSMSEKEKELKDIIADAKQKLKKIQEKQKTDIGELACSNGLNEFDLDVLDGSFKNLYAELSQKK